MSWTFIGRARELAALEEQYREPEANFIPIYGRRRVGKSELILHFKKERPGVYFVGKQAPAALQVREFLRTAARALNEPLLARADITDWKVSLSEVVQRWRGPGKLILVLDEFQWMVEDDRSLPSVVQELWDREWQHSGKLMLILAGSYVGFMEREVLGSQKPLGGRRTARILLEPFKFWEAAQFHPSLSREDQARIYFITGGIPLYLLAFKQSKSIEQNICGTLLDEFSPLSHESEFLLREELQGLERFQAVLDTLASGRKPLNEIAKAVAVDSRSITYQLQTLTALGYVERVLPLMAKDAPARHVRYGLGDAFLRFWYRFVFPNQSLIRANPAAAFKDLIAGDLESYFGQCFERLCREALSRIYSKEKVGAAYKVGEYWDKRVQIDVVGLRQDNWIDLGECKWGSVPSVPELSAELESRVKLYPNVNNATLGRLIFTRRPVKAPKRESPARFFSLEELYSMG
jgi:AAA+ ATPase superfamily predicted ATPase